MLLTGSIGLLVAVAPPLLKTGNSVATWISAIGFVVAAYGLLMGSYMTYGSRIGKLRNRENLFDLAATLRPWSGDEIVLDVECGRGLMLVGAARRLTTGHAVGIDLWREEDQSENSPEALEANARSEGVVDRIRIDTGDAIEGNDLLIAAQALALEHTFVTDNDKDFSRIEGLRVENWLKD